MKKFSFTSENGPCLDIPFGESWESLIVDAPITVYYHESAEEKMQLKIPEGMSGTLLLDTHDSGSLTVSCALPGGIDRADELTLEIHHAGLRSISLRGATWVKAFGTLHLSEIHVSQLASLNLGKAIVKSGLLLVDLSDHGVCSTEVIEAETVRILQSGNSILFGTGIRPCELVSLTVRDQSYVFLQGKALHFESEQYGESRLMANGLEAEKGTCIVRLKSLLNCNVRELSYYVSKTASFGNQCASAVSHAMEDVAVFRPLYELPVDDAWQLLLHLKPDASLSLHQLVVPYLLYSGTYEAFKRTVRNGQEVWVNRWNQEMEIMKVRLSFATSMSESGTVLVGIPEDAVDWEAIPEVRQRFLEILPNLYECYLHDCFFGWPLKK